MKKKFLATVMAIVCTLSLAACGGDSGNGDQSGSSNPGGNTSGSGGGNEGQESNSGGEGNDAQGTASTLPDTLENPNLVIVWDTTEEAWNKDKEDKAAEGKEAFHKIWSTKEAFEAKYGGTVEVIGVGWGEMQSTVIAKVNAGEVCDLAQAHDQNFPTYGAKKVMQDISQYIDVNDNFWNDSITEAFSFGGVPYAVGVSASPFVISYNKTLFDQMGVKTPIEYYNEGNWTWDTFREVGLQMTGDTDGDGNMDIYGFGWWDGIYTQLMASNGANTINYTSADGVVSSNYLTPQATETFTFLQNAYITDKFMMIPDGDKFVSDFKSGKLAMTCEYGFGAVGNYEDCDYEIAWAPMPIGPSAQTYECGGALTGFCIPVTSKNPEGAAVFIRMASELEKEYDNKVSIDKYGQDQVDLMDSLKAHIRFTPIGIEKYFDANWTIHSGLIEGTPVSTFATNADEQIKEGASITLGN